MTRIKKWICMLVLTITLVPTTNVSADTYTSKDNTIIGSNYYDFFEAQFGEDKNYKFFAYDCYGSGTYTRTCYYGIDNDFNYVKVSYNSENELNITKGIDTEFSVTGNNIINVKPSFTSQLVRAIAFIFIFFVVYIMLGVIFI